MIGKLRRALRPRFRKRSYAQHQFDLKLLPYLNYRDGFFVEVGANDGVTQSNTLYFEKYKGWRGLLIEAIPDLAHKCRRNRPRCIVENCALVASDYSEETVQMRYCNLMSVVKGAMSGEEEQRHIQSGRRFLLENENAYTITVPAKTLSEVLSQHHIERIDLLSLDVEGYEAQVLRGVDFARHRPEFMLIEVRSQMDVESLIQCHYASVAVLSMNEEYSDILYRRK